MGLGGEGGGFEPFRRGQPAIRRKLAQLLMVSKSATTMCAVNV